MTELQWAAIMGFVVTFVTSLLKNPTWPHQVKHIVMLVVSFIGAVGSHVIASGGQWDWEPVQLFLNLAVVAAIAQANYQLWFKDTPVENRLEAVKVLP